MWSVMVLATGLLVAEAHIQRTVVETEAPLFGASLSVRDADQYVVVVEDENAFRNQIDTIKGAEVLREHSIGDWKAAFVKASGEALKAIRKLPCVKMVTTNYVVDLNDFEAHKKKKKPEQKRKKEMDNHTVYKSDAKKKKYIVQVDAKKAEKFKEKLSKSRGKVMQEYDVVAMHTIVIETDEKTAEQLKQDPDVIDIQENLKYSMFSDEVTEVPMTTMAEECMEQEPGEGLWGLGRISADFYDPDDPQPGYRYSMYDDGTGIDIYVIDSGIYLEHEEFEGRASWGWTAPDLSEVDRDLNGHGTHVASIAAGRTLGVAKNANIIAVKALGESGFSTAEIIIGCVEWTVRDIVSKGTASRTVVNMSLGGQFRDAVLEGAVQAGIDQGITFTIASGNSGSDACAFSPSKVSSAISVASSNSDDELSYFSNYGPCIDIIAPGEDIKGAWIDSQTDTVIESGTSMAAPMVAGVVARYLSSLDADQHPTAMDVKSFIVDSAVLNQITFIYDVELSTPNELLHIECNDNFVPPTLMPTREPPSSCMSQHANQMWHLARVSSRKKRINFMNSEYEYSDKDDGTGVDAYIVDTGIFLSHQEFENRASWGHTASGLFESDQDLNGHGTHVASLVGGKLAGVAKKAHLIAVKTLDMFGNGELTMLLDGLEWIGEDIQKKRANGNKRRPVINMSLGFPQGVYLLEAAVHELVALGATVIAAAGNSDVPACNFSPARSSSVITVAASNKANTLTYFSNFGSCIDIGAPGRDIVGASHLYESGFIEQSGTSQAAPIVAGAVARYLSSFSDDERWPTPAEVHAHLLKTSTPLFRHTEGDSGTPTALLYCGCGPDDDDSGAATVVTSVGFIFSTVMYHML